MAGDMKKNKGNNALMLHPQLSGVLLFYACSFFFALFEYPAHAENLPDPTRPPSEFESTAGGGAAVRSGPVLQSVLISPRYKAAIINGETVKLGGIYGSARVVEIGEGGVVLDEGGSLRTLELFPNVEKKIPRSKEATAPTAIKSPRSKRSAVRTEEE